MPPSRCLQLRGQRLFYRVWHQVRADDFPTAVGVVFWIHELQPPMPGVPSKTFSLKLIKHPDSLINSIKIDGGITDGGVLHPVDRPAPPTPEILCREVLHCFGEIVVRGYPLNHPEPIRIQIVDSDPRGGVLTVLVRWADELPHLQIGLRWDTSLRFFELPVFP